MQQALSEDKQAFSMNGSVVQQADLEPHFKFYW